MADVNKRIKITGEENVSSLMDRMRQKATSVARDLIKDAREYSASGREVTKYIEDQIRLLERRQKLEQESKRYSTNEKFDLDKRQHGTRRQKEEVEQDRKGALSNLKEEGREQATQISLLREIIDTIRSTAKEEIKEDRKSVEEVITKDKGIELLGVPKDQKEEEALKRTFQREIIGTVAKEEVEEKESFKSRAGRYTEQTSTTAARVGVQPNEFYMAAALMGMIPFVGIGLSTVLTKAFHESSQLEQGLGATYAATGTRQDLLGYDESSKLGVSQSQFLQQYVSNAVRSRGSSEEGMRQAIDILKAEKGLGIDQNTLSTMLRVERSDKSGVSITESIDRFVSIMSDTGVFGQTGKDFAKLPELMSLSNQINQEQVQRLGSVDSTLNTKMLREFTNLSDKFSNTDVLNTTYSTVDQGLRNPSGQYAQAMQFAVLSRTNPSMDRFQLMKEQEKGMANPDLLRGMLGQYQKMTGVTSMSSQYTKDVFYEQIKATFPQLSYSLSEEIGKGFLEGRMDNKSITGLLGRAKGVVDERAGGYGEIITLSAETAHLSEKFAQAGQTFVDTAKQVSDEFSKADGFLANSRAAAHAVALFTKAIGSATSTLGGGQPTIHTPGGR